MAVQNSNCLTCKYDFSMDKPMFLGSLNDYN